MAPAFSSPRQAGAFALLLLVLLLSPILAVKSILPTREQMYANFPRDPYLHHEIFEESSDLDIALLSSSRLGCALNAPYLEKKLSEKLGRPATIRTLCWTWNGYDPLYFIAQDLLQHRKVHLIIFCDLSDGTANTAHLQASDWFRWADNDASLEGVPFKAKVSFYAAALLGLPQNLLAWVRPNLPTIPSHEIVWYHAAAPYSPQTKASPADVLTYSDATKDNFRFTKLPLVATQAAFVQKIGALVEEHHTQLALLHLPEYPERKASQIEAGTFWPDAFHTSIPMVGIPSATLFAGLTDEEIHRLFLDDVHLNSNGQDYFTPLVAPSLLQIYEETIKP